MLGAPQFPIVPMLSSVLVPTTTAPVSQMLIAPPQGEDAFILLPDGMLPVSPAAQASADEGEAPVDLLTHPARRKRLGHLIQNARAARGALDAPRADAAYRSAMLLLAAPLSGDPQGRPLYLHLQNGGALLKEAIFGAAAFSRPEEASANIPMLAQFIDHPPPGNASPLDLSRARVLLAYSWMQTPPDDHDATLWRASTLLQEVIRDIEEEETRTPAIIVHFAALILLIDVKMRLVRSSDLSGPVPSTREHVSELLAYLRTARSAYGAGENGPFLADLEADLAIEICSMGFLRYALELARAVTSFPVRSPAAQERILDAAAFAPFVRGRTILSDDEALRTSRLRPWHERARTMLLRAHVKNPLAYLKLGIPGMFLGWLANRVAEGDSAAAASGIAAAAAIGGYRLWVGAHDEDAAYDCFRADTHRSASDTATAAVSLALRAAADAAIFGGLMSAATGISRREGLIYDLIARLAQLIS
jgi:hypothetical protein